MENKIVKITKSEFANLSGDMKLKIWLRLRGSTPRKIGRELGVCPESLYRYLRGSYVIPEEVIKLAELDLLHRRLLKNG